MADSEAVRSRRKRKHAQGDHSMCRHPRESVPPVTVLPGDGELDPVTELRRSAARLVAACEADPSNAVLARELRATLAVLPQAEAADPLDGLRQRAWLKRLGWAPGDDPELRDLARELTFGDPLEVLRDIAREVP